MHPLIKEALTAREKAQAKYSGFAVGAAVATDKGVFLGANIECSSYGLSLCAERLALAKAITEGATSITTLAIVGSSSQPLAPCGACRQWLIDFAPAALIVYANTSGDERIATVAELMPDAFCSDHLRTSD
jgi:cytidine deaminase